MENGQEILGVKGWATNVMCECCHKNIQHYPIYLPISRTTPCKERPGTMDPPDFLRICVNCLPSKVEYITDLFKKGKLFPLKIWEDMQIVNAEYVTKNGEVVPANSPEIKKPENKE